MSAIIQVNWILWIFMKSYDTQLKHNYQKIQICQICRIYLENTETTILSNKLNPAINQLCLEGKKTYSFVCTGQNLAIMYTFVSAGVQLYINTHLSHSPRLITHTHPFTPSQILVIESLIHPLNSLNLTHHTPQHAHTFRHT